MQIPLTCIAVLGAERQQILSASGVASSQPYTDRKVSFCAWLLVPEQPELLIVEDLTADSRCALSTHISDPHFGVFWLFWFWLDCWYKNQDEQELCHRRR